MTMTPERELWAVARLYMERHGGDAWRLVGRRISELSMAGDEAGARKWLAIQDCIVRLRNRPTGADSLQ